MDAQTLDQLSNANAEPEVFEVEPENWDAVQLWQRIQTQWQRGDLNVKSGLRYEGVEFVAGKLGFELDEVLFTQIQLMEKEALGIEAERLRESLKR